MVIGRVAGREAKQRPVCVCWSVFDGFDYLVGGCDLNEGDSWHFSVVDCSV